jgi:hypothetical protein
MRFHRRARDRQDTQDHELGKDFSIRNQRGQGRRQWSYCQKVADDAMLRAVLVIAVVLLPGWLTGRLTVRLIATRFVILAGVVTVCATVRVMVARVVMAAVLTSTGIVLDGSAIGPEMLVGLAMVRAMAVIVPR